MFQLQPTLPSTAYILTWLRYFQLSYDMFSRSSFNETLCWGFFYRTNLMIDIFYNEFLIDQSFQAHNRCLTRAFLGKLATNWRK